MDRYRTPGIYMNEVDFAVRRIKSVATSTVGFVGVAETPVHRNEPVLITSWSDYVRRFGRYRTKSFYLASAIYSFFDNGGCRCYVVNVDNHINVTLIGTDDGRGSCTGLQALDVVSEVSIVCIPGGTDLEVQQAMIEHCEKNGDRFCILDSIKGADLDTVLAQRSRIVSENGVGALYYPWIKTEVELTDRLNRVVTKEVLMPPSGAVAGIYARTDMEQGVHKAPANEVVTDALGLERTVTQAEQETLNPYGVNCIRAIGKQGIRVWGTRTIAPLGSEWKYVPVRRLMIQLEKSIDKGTQWVVFETNSERLWSSVVQSVSEFLVSKWREGVLMGPTPEDAFFVKCDRSTMTQEDIGKGRLVVEVGVALVKPAEFLVFRVTQWMVGSEHR